MDCRLGIWCSMETDETLRVYEVMTENDYQWGNEADLKYLLEVQ